MESTTLMKFTPLLCDAFGVDNLILEENEIIPYLKKYKYILPYNEDNNDNNDNDIVVSSIVDDKQRLSNELCDLLSIPNNSFLTKIEVIQKFNSYVIENNLNVKKTIIPNDKLKQVFSLEDNQTIKYIEIYSYLKKHLTQVKL